METQSVLQDLCCGQPSLRIAAAGTSEEYVSTFRKHPAYTLENRWKIREKTTGTRGKGLRLLWKLDEDTLRNISQVVKLHP